jgi:DNA-binding transcriptional regulator YiaG
MNTKTPAPYPTPSPADFEALRARLGLSVDGLARYLGAPVTTVRKWTTGKRVPPAAVAYLVHVLGTIEALAPAVHAALMPMADAAPRRGRPPKQV